MATTDNNGDEITADDDVTLGDLITIAVEATDNAITDFYLGDCVAENGDQFQADGTTPNADYRSLQIVTGGCMEDLGTLSTDFNASTGTTGKSLIFQQFAFADASQAALTLNFQVTCDIILGTAPTDDECAQTRDDGDISLTGDAGRRRRATRRAA